MSLEEIIYDTKPKLDEITFRDVLKSTKHKDKKLSKGFFIENYVRYWLEKTEEIELHKNKNNLKVKYPYNYLPNHIGNFFISKNRDTLFEIDGLISIGIYFYYIEVKSGKLNGFGSKIKERIDTGYKSLKNFKGLIVFIPFKHDSLKRFQDIKKNYKHNSLYFINNNYNYKYLKEMANEFGYTFSDN